MLPVPGGPVEKILPQGVEMFDTALYIVLCSKINVLEVINTDDIITEFASQKERKNYLYK
jgi:hypothetical protein